MRENKRNFWRPVWILFRKWRWRKHLFLKGLSAALLLGCWIVYSAPVTVHAYPVAGGCRYPRNDCGYFYGRNEPEPYDFVFACGLYDNNITKLKTDILNYANGTATAADLPPNCPPNLGASQLKAGADFIILTMLGGFPPGTPKTAVTPAVEADWVRKVDNANAMGWINFNWRIPASGAEWCDNTANQIASPDIARLNDCVFGQPAILFSYPGGGHYVIKQQCGNPIGNFSALPNPITYACGTAKSMPATIQPNDNFTTTIDDTYMNGPPPANTYFNISIPRLIPPYNDAHATPQSTSPTIKFKTPTLRAPPQAGAYTVNWQLYDSAGNPLGPSCHGSVTVVDLPYFSIFGSDISAGGGYTPNCGASGVIGGWYDSAAANAGANTQFGAISLGQVGGFGSAQNDAGGPPNGLTFANTAGITRASPSQYFGGNFGGTHCLDLIQQPATNTPANSPVAVTALANGANTYTGNMTLTGGQIPLGQNVSLFVTGDVYINGPDITYQDAGGGWAVSANGTTNVPSFVLVASGNIYIDNSVGNLDGIYEAGGTIYTCGLNTFAAETPANMYANCGNQLTVHGSFIAKQVNLMRSVGTLEDATTGEDPRGGAHACANGPALPVCAGEVFDFSPEMYMSDPAILQQTNGNPTYNTVTSLPPVL